MNFELLDSTVDRVLSYEQYSTKNICHFEIKSNQAKIARFIDLFAGLGGTIFYHNPETGNIQGKNILGALEQAGVETEEIWGIVGIPSDFF